VISGRKIVTSDFHRPLLKSILHHKESFVEIETNGILMVQGQDYKEVASKLPNQVLLIFDELPKMCEVWRRDGRQHLSYWSILVAFSRLFGVIFPIVNRG